MALGGWLRKGPPLVLAGLACIVLASCHRPLPDSKKDASRQRDDLSRQIQKLRREVVMLRQVTKGMEVDISNLEKTTATPEAELQQLQREVFNLARALDPKAEHSSLGGPSLSLPLISGTSQSLDVAIPEGYVGQGYRLFNVGQSIIKDPLITFEGTTPIDSVENILGTVLKGKSDDQEKAVALWDFVRAARQHYYPSQQGNEIEDPVKLANIYGYGYCDDAATALAWLATAAGYQARVWDLNGHVVPEVFYSGSWHMLDPDEQVYYFDDEGKIASVDWLAAHPETIENLQGGKHATTARLAEFYRTKSDNDLEKADKKIKGPIHRMAFSLRPGEEITISAEPGGKFFSAQYYWTHPPHGTGRWVFAPVLKDKVFEVGAEKVENLHVVRTGTGSILQLADTAKGSLTYEFSPSYPILDGEVKGVGHIADSTGFFLEFSSDGKTWKQVANVRGPLRGAWSVPLTDCFPNGYGIPLYRCFLRFRFSPGKTDAVEITSLQISLDLKVAPKSVPALGAGAHQILYTSRGGPGDAARAEILIAPTKKTP